MIDRLFNYLKAKGISDAEFARMINKSPQHINTLKQRGSIGIKVILDIVEAFPDIDLNWLILGRAYNTKGLVDHVEEEQRDSYQARASIKKGTCLECENKDKLISRYERLCETQENTIKRLENELLSAQDQKTG